MVTEPKATQLNTTQPADWVRAWQEAAIDSQLTLSEWIGAACNRSLPKEVRKELSERTRRGKRRKTLK